MAVQVVRSNEVHHTLRNARAIQAERGHAKYTLVDKQGHVCMEGAILMAQGVHIPFPYIPTSTRVAVQASTKALGFSFVGEMCAWNNETGRTLEEVLARFDEAIERTKPEEPNEPAEPAIEARELVTTP